MSQRKYCKSQILRDEWSQSRATVIMLAMVQVEVGGEQETQKLRKKEKSHCPQIYVKLKEI